VACREFDDALCNGEFNEKFTESAKKGTDIYSANLPFSSEERNDGEVIDICSSQALGEYLVFCYPSDVLKENHFENYLSEIDETDLDLVLFDLDFDVPNAQYRKKVEFSHGNVSLKNVIIKTETFRKHKVLMDFNQDTEKKPWNFLQGLLKCRYKRSENDPTYLVKSTKNNGTFDEID